MKNTDLKRMYIYPKDVARITGKGSSYCRNILHQIKLVYGKQKHHGVTITEYCDYMGVEREEVELYL